MGDYANDLRNDHSHELDESEELDELGFPLNFVTFVPSDKQPVRLLGKVPYSVRILHRKTMVEHWSGEVMASSEKDAQQQFRKEYSEVRSKYTHEYGLAIKKK